MSRPAITAARILSPSMTEGGYRGLIEMNSVSRLEAQGRTPAASGVR